MLPKHLLDQALSPFAAGLGPEARPRSHPVPVLGHWCMPRESGVLRVLLVPILPSCFLPCPRFSTVEPSGLLLYNGRLNERHDFLAVEIIQGQVQLKYSTGKLGPACHRICAVGATRRPALSRERGVLAWMEPVLREVGLREVLVSVSGWHRRQVCVSGLSLGLGVHVQQGCCEHKPFWGLQLLFCPIASL